VLLQLNFGQVCLQINCGGKVSRQCRVHVNEWWQVEMTHLCSLVFQGTRLPHAGQTLEVSKFTTVPTRNDFLSRRAEQV